MRLKTLLFVNGKYDYIRSRDLERKRGYTCIKVDVQNVKRPNETKKDGETKNVLREFT